MVEPSNEFVFCTLETGVFLEFPIETRKALAKEITNVFVTKPMVKGSALASAAHVNLPIPFLWLISTLKLYLMC